MATFVSGYISDLSPVKDNIKLCVRILHAWLQPLYNNQQDTKIQAIVRIDKLKRFQHHLKEVVVGQVIACENLDNYDKNRKAGIKKLVTLIDGEGNEIKCMLWGDHAQRFNDFLNSCDDHGRIVLVLKFAMMQFWDGKMCIQNEYWGTKLYLFDGNKAIYEDEYKEVEEFRQRLFANQPSQQSKNTATKISIASKNSTKDTFVNKHPIRNIAELLDVEQGMPWQGYKIDLESEMPKKRDGPNDWWLIDIELYPGKAYPGRSSDRGCD
nr:replication protein A 70 kDa DNA-binding subunit B [Tanacetum cinerariifolium]